MKRPILLDTCAVIWIAEGDRLTAEGVGAIEEAHSDAVPICISPVTAWEVGLLASRGRVALSRDLDLWFERMLSQGFELAPLTPQILIGSSFLPGARLRDPADRILATTARRYDFRLLTRDRVLLDYGAEGHLAVIAC